MQVLGFPLEAAAPLRPTLLGLEVWEGPEAEGVLQPGAEAEQPAAMPQPHVLPAICIGQHTWTQTLVCVIKTLNTAPHRHCEVQHEHRTHTLPLPLIHHYIDTNQQLVPLHFQAFTEKLSCEYNVRKNVIIDFS